MDIRRTVKGGAKTSKPVRIHVIRGLLWSKLSGIALTTTILRKLGNCMVKTFSIESKKYLAKRGWNGRDPMGGPELWNSFSYHVIGNRDVEILSSFYGMKELAHGNIPSRRMVWLTQEAKEKNPQNYKLSPREKTLGMNPMSKNRMPLIVPIKTKAGTVEFRTAPLKLTNAWVHPGIAKFTFFETAIRNGRKACIDIIRKSS